MAKTNLLQEAVVNELSYERLRELVHEALYETYPCMNSNGEPVEWGGSRFYINQLWQTRVLLKNRDYVGMDDDPAWALADFTVAKDLSSVELGELVPVQITATPIAGGDAFVLEESLEPDIGDNIAEAGKRNSAVDLVHLNNALRSLMHIMDQGGLHGKTKAMMGTLMAKSGDVASGLAASSNGENTISANNIAEAQWTAAYVNNLPDSSFAVISSGGSKDKSGRTSPRSLRHLPYKDTNGAIDLAHLRNALARLSQTNLTNDEKAKAQSTLNAAAKKAGVGESQGNLSDHIVESWSGMPGETISENFAASLIESKFNEADLILERTVVLGPASLNNRLYPIEVQERAIPIFEGAKAYLNHPATPVIGDARDVRDYIGLHQNVRVIGNKTYSDLHLINNETVQKHILPIIKDRTHHSSVGNSIVARATMEKGKDGVYTVTEIHEARSIDLVSEPGTTKGLFESYNPTQEENTVELKDITLELVMKDRPDLVEAILKTKTTEQETAKAKIDLEKLAQENVELTKKLADVELKEAKRAIEVEIDGLVATMKIPDAVKYETKEGIRQIKPLFRNLLTRCGNIEERKGFISDWEATYQEAPPAKMPIAVESSITFHGHNEAPAASNLAKLYQAIVN